MAAQPFFQRARRVLFYATLAGAAFAAMPGAAVELPSRAPIPQIRGNPVDNSKDSPEKAPAEAQSSVRRQSAMLARLDFIPLPEPRPDPAASPGNSPKPTEDAKTAFLPDLRSAVRPSVAAPMPATEIACRERLTLLGVRFADRPPEADPVGCSIPYPVIVKSLGADIELRPDAEMNCAMAEAAARFAATVVSPAAKAEFGQSLQSVSHASAYVCRARNGTRKLSEHAFGNALDIASFTLADGTTIAVEPEPEKPAGRFLDKLRDRACGPFKTVLGPGSDADHAFHFHFDLAPRRNGGTFCQ